MVVVRPIKPMDIEQMSRWGTHSDPRFDAYNFPYETPFEYLMWYHTKKKWFRKYIYGVFDGPRLIGYITFKHINWFKRTGEMGIAFDPNFLSQGHGTEALRLYLKHIFTTFPIDRVWLKTASFNQRARRCYEKVGFTYYDEKFEPYEDQAHRFELILTYDDFQMVDEELWAHYVYMEVYRKDFMK